MSIHKKLIYYISEVHFFGLIVRGKKKEKKFLTIHQPSFTWKYDET